MEAGQPCKKKQSNTAKQITWQFHVDFFKWQAKRMKKEYIFQAGNCILMFENVIFISVRQSSFPSHTTAKGRLKLLLQNCNVKFLIWEAPFKMLTMHLPFQIQILADLKFNIFSSIESSSYQSQAQTTYIRLKKNHTIALYYHIYPRITAVIPQF